MQSVIKVSEYRKLTENILPSLVSATECVPPQDICSCPKHIDFMINFRAFLNVKIIAKQKTLPTLVKPNYLRTAIWNGHDMPGNQLLPEQYLLLLEAGPSGEPFYCFCHLQIQAAHVLLFPKHRPIKIRRRKTVDIYENIHL